MQTEKQVYTRKKLTVPFVDLKQSSFIGKILGFDSGYSRTWENPFVIIRLQSPEGDTYNAVLDGGLRGALKLARLIEGEVKMTETYADVSGIKVLKDAMIEIVHTGTKEVDQGECNTYDIFELQPNN